MRRMTFWSRFRARPIEALVGRVVDDALTFGEVRRESDELSDDIPSDARAQWRCVDLLATGFAGRASVPPQLFLRYRTSDRRVWSGRLSNVGISRGFSLGGAKAPFDFAALLERLGAPNRSQQLTVTQRGHWFERGPLLYIAKAQTTDDALFIGSVTGSLSYVTVVNLALAPPGFDGDWRASRRSVFVRFPGSHAAFLQALVPSLGLTALSEQRADWSAKCGSISVSGSAQHGIEEVHASDDAFAEKVRAAVTALGTVL